MPVAVAPERRVKKRLTLEDWLALPEGPPFYELEDGELIEMPSPRREHQRIVSRLTVLLDDYVTEHNLGTVVMAVDVALPTGHGYIPDIAFISHERENELLKPDGKVHGSPDLVIEISSPSTARRDRVKKFLKYWEAGVKWYWVVDALEMTVEEYEWTEGGYLCTARVDTGEDFEPRAFKGLKINIAKLMKVKRQRNTPRRKRRTSG